MKPSVLARWLRVPRRLHAPGVLARLRYETLDAAGATLEVWDVRALVPRLPDIAPPRDREHPVLGPVGCPPECQAGLARWNGRLLTALR